MVLRPVLWLSVVLVCLAVAIGVLLFVVLVVVQMGSRFGKYFWVMLFFLS